MLEIDWSDLLSAALGGALAITGGYIAVVVAERARRGEARDERLRVINRAVIDDTRAYLLALLDVSMGRALNSPTPEADYGWPAAARAKRIEQGILGDAELLGDFRRVTNHLVAVHFSQRFGSGVEVQSLTPDIATATTELRARLTAAFIELERRVEEGEGITLLDRDTVKQIERDNPLSDLWLPAEDLN